MATEFRTKSGARVALRWWGGEDAGLRVDLLEGAATVKMSTPLRGDDGSRETLRTLAEQVGTGARWKVQR